jgi:hypothetical protein
MMNSNINRVVSNLGDLKMVRFGLDSNISCGDIPILNSENLFDILYGEYGIYPETIYIISLVFTCSDNSFYYINESVEFNSAYLFSEEFGNFFNELYNFVKEHKEKTESETGLDSSVVDIIIYEDVNECD